MKILITLLALLILIGGGFFFLNHYIYTEKQSVSSESAKKCLVSGEYTFNEYIGACVRGGEMTPDIEEMARMAITHKGSSDIFTIVSFNSYEEVGAYDITLRTHKNDEEETIYIRNGQIMPAPSHEMAEITGFQFMRDVVTVGGQESNEEVENRLYASLSSVGRGSVSPDTLKEDVLLFVGVDEVPSQGVSVEDLFVSDRTAVLTLGLNYQTGRILKNVHLVVEDMMWKVAQVTSL